MAWYIIGLIVLAIIAGILAFIIFILSIELNFYRDINRYRGKQIEVYEEISKIERAQIEIYKEYTDEMTKLWGEQIDRSHNFCLKINKEWRDWIEKQEAKK